MSIRIAWRKSITLLAIRVRWMFPVKGKIAAMHIELDAYGRRNR